MSRRAAPDQRYFSSLLLVVGRVVGEAQIAEFHERRGDPSAERTEVVVEQLVGAVGERLFGEFVHAWYTISAACSTGRDVSVAEMISLLMLSRDKCWVPSRGLVSAATPAMSAVSGAPESRCTRNTISSSITGAS